MANTPAPNSQGALLNQLSGENALQTGVGNLQTQLGQEQLGLTGAQLGQTEAYQQAMSGYQAQNLGLGEQALGIQGTGLAEQGAQAATQQGFEEQQYALQAGQYPEQQAEAALAYQNAMRNTQGQQAIGGTQNTVGGQADVSTLKQNYGFQQQDIARAQALSQLGQKSEESGYGYTQEQLQNAQQNLALNAKANGISEQQLLTMLNYGQSQTAETGAQDIISLLSNLGSTVSGNLSNAGGALSNIGFASGLNALAGVG